MSTGVFSGKPDEMQGVNLVMGCYPIQGRYMRSNTSSHFMLLRLDGPHLSLTSL